MSFSLVEEIVVSEEGDITKHQLHLTLRGDQPQNVSAGRH